MQMLLCNFALVEYMRALLPELPQDVAVLVALLPQSAARVLQVLDYHLVYATALHLERRHLGGGETGKLNAKRGCFH